jgi:hypothetical protein
MAVTLVTTTKHYQGLSTDTKPTAADVPVGATFLATDTRHAFVYNGREWGRDKATEVEQAPQIEVVKTDLQAAVLVQLKIQNAHLALVTGEKISEEELDVTN